ncbi:MAG TPA: sulfatase [Capsulimonadaceae bacterium]|jgi:arylsulfatase A-like enzyme
MNIVLLHSHDAGCMVQPYGYPVATPRIQQFAESGVLFRKAFCAAPTCSPSRAAMLTGVWPHETGMLGLAHRGFDLNDTSKHLVHTLKLAGYETALCGIQHEAADPSTLGYDKILATYPARGVDIAPVACDYIAQPHDKPFFLSFGLFDTHRPFPEPSVDARYVRVPSPLPDTPETRYDMAAFATAAAGMDEGFGRVIDAIEDAGLTANTLVIMTTDHGLAFPGMKCTLTDRGLGVMLIISQPGAIAEGVVVDEMVTHLDLYPTICELAGIGPPTWLRGKSLASALRGSTTLLHEATFGEVSFHAAYEPQRSVRTKRYKYIRRFDERAKPVLPNCDAGPSKSVWLDHGWRDAQGEQEELYDLIFDPDESRSLVKDNSHVAVLAEMRTTLHRWMVETSDPLLDAPLYAPAGSRVCDTDAIDPEDGIVYYAERTRMG